MPYLDIPQSNISNSIAKVVGSLQGKLLSNVQDQISTSRSSLKKPICPTLVQIDKIKKRTGKLNSSVNGAQSKINSFRRLSRALKVPLSTFKAVKKVILTLPIPQSVPPGFGLPISITTAYANILNLIKELIKQIDEDVTSITAILDNSGATISSLNKNLTLIDSATKCCEVSRLLEKEVKEGNLSKRELIDIGILNENGTSILTDIKLNILGYGVLAEDAQEEIDERDLEGASAQDLDRAGILESFLETIGKENLLEEQPVETITLAKEDKVKLRDFLSNLEEVEKSSLNSIIKNRNEENTEPSIDLIPADLDKLGILDFFVKSKNAEIEQNLIADQEGNTIPTTTAVNTKLSALELKNSNKFTDSLHKEVLKFVKELEKTTNSLVLKFNDREKGITTLEDLRAESDSGKSGYILDLEEKGLLEYVESLVSSKKGSDFKLSTITSTEKAEIKNIILNVNRGCNNLLKKVKRSKSFKPATSEEAIQKLKQVLNKLEDSSISKTILSNLEQITGTLSSIREGTDGGSKEPGTVSYRSPSGEVYVIKVKEDMKFSKIAPRHYAVAVDTTGIEVLKGSPSFTSDTNVLIEEIKLLIDNLGN